jgi:hypothetical protein
MEVLSLSVACRRHGCRIPERHSEGVASACISYCRRDDRFLRLGLQRSLRALRQAQRSAGNGEPDTRVPGARVSAPEASDAAATALLSRPIKHILPLHISRFGANTLDGLLTTLEQHHARFVSLDGALSDPVYADQLQTQSAARDLVAEIRTAPHGPRAASSPPAELLATICR